MPQRGALEPALPVVEELLKRGHEVHAVTHRVAIHLPSDIAITYDEFPSGWVSSPPNDFDEALQGKARLAKYHFAHVSQLIRSLDIDIVLADGFRLSAGLAAEQAGQPWVAYTHHYFDESEISEGIVEQHWQRFRRSRDLRDTFAQWWGQLRRELGLATERRGLDELCWWNLSPHTTLVLGLPELKVHATIAPQYVHRVGPTLWSPPGNEPLPPWIQALGNSRPAVLVSLSSTPVDDSGLANHAALALGGEYEVVVTAGGKAIPDFPESVVVARDLPHAWLMDRVSAVVCSAGHGIVTRSACAGMGVVAVPRFGDQFLVASAVEATGLGFQLSPDRLTVDALATAVATLERPDLAARRKALAEKAATYRAAQRCVQLVEAASA